MNACERILLFGCGILKKEVQWLIERNGWPVDAQFVDPALHCELDKLSKTLTVALRKYAERRLVVLYGACHPLMDKMLAEAGTFRTEGQNCVEMLLGRATFSEELAKGAYFLLEEMARRWDYILKHTFGAARREVIQEIFHCDRTHLLCLRTPCSGDFTAEAEHAAETVAMPLRWMDVPLDHLETVLRAAIARRLREVPPCRS